MSTCHQNDNESLPPTSSTVNEGTVIDSSCSDSNVTVSRPDVQSLSEWHVALSDAVRVHLEHDLGRERLDAMLESMKVPPATTIVRWNPPLITDGAAARCLADALRDLHQCLTEWIDQRPRIDFNDASGEIEPSFSVQVYPHECLPDVVCVCIRHANGTEEHCTETQDSIDRRNETLSTDRVPTSRLSKIDTTEAVPLDAWRRAACAGQHDTHGGTSRSNTRRSKVVITDRYCGEAILRGANVYIPGVVCTDSSLCKGDWVAVYADMGPHATASSQASTLTRGMRLTHYNRTAVFMGLGISQCHRAYIFQHPPTTGLAVVMVQTSASSTFLLPPLNELWTVPLQRDWYCQNLPSTTVPLALLLGGTTAPVVYHEHDEFAVLDMCCAPGGKTSHLASLLFRTRPEAMDNDPTRVLDVLNDGPPDSTICLVACDKSRRKVIEARDVTWNRLGCSHLITPLALDTTKAVLAKRPHAAHSSVQELLNAATPSNDGLLNVVGFYPESFDRILLDPPCSALGLRPKLSVAQGTVSSLESVCAYQRQFIANAVALLKPGGYLTYSTCTIHTQENEGMVRYLLDHYPCMELMDIPLSRKVGGPGLPGVLTPSECQAVRRFDPSDREADTMGFFLAKFRKNGTPEIHNSDPTSFNA